LHAAEVLTVLAEISIALAGFAGIVVALRQRGLREFESHELVRFWFMLGIACELLFFALLPFLLHYTSQGVGRTWGLSSGALAAGLLATAIFGYLQTRDAVLSKSRWTLSYISGCLTFSAVALANSLSMMGSPQPGFYLAGLGWLLFFSTSLFIRLVRASVADSPEPPAPSAEP
jgi:hypothetical protein